MRYVIEGMGPGCQLYMGDKTGRFTIISADGSFRAEENEIPYLEGMGFTVKPTDLTGDVIEKSIWFDPSGMPAIAKNQEAAVKIAAEYDKVPVPKRSKR